MTRGIPSRGNIPQNVRRKKQVEQKTKAGSKMTRRMGVNIGTVVGGGPVTGRKQTASEPYLIEGKPTVEKRPGKKTLEKLLAWGQQEEQMCLELLRMLPSELPEYNEVLERLGKLQDVLEQVKRQLTSQKIAPMSIFQPGFK